MADAQKSELPKPGTQRPESSNSDGNVQIRVAIIGGIFALLVALIGGGITVWSTIVNRPPLEMTPTPISTSTFTSVASPTSVLTVTPTLSTASTIPSFITGITGNGTLVMHDPLLDNGRGYFWDVHPTGNAGSCIFTSSGYQFKSTNYFQNCQEYGVNNLTNFVLEAYMTPQQGSAGGFILRNTGNSGAGYYIDFGPSGYYEAFRNPNNTALKQNTLSSLIPKDQASYRVDIAAVGKQITLYVDSTKIDTITDSTYSNGRIGFYVTGDCPTCSNTQVIFTNLTVWSL